MVLMCLERIMFRFRYTEVDDKESLLARKSRMIIKLSLHVFAVVLLHLALVFYWPMKLSMRMSLQKPLIIFYLLWCGYFIFSC